MSVLVLFFATAIGGGWWLWRNDLVSEWAEKGERTVLQWTVQMGFGLEEVLVVGRRETSTKDLLAALGLVRGQPMLAMDLHQARQRVETLPWVRRATVERLLPDTVLLSVEERQPLAVWQYGGSLSLIDEEGEVIGKAGLRRYADLPLVVGEDAPAHAVELFSILSKQPQLMKLVEAAVRVGGRRWNVRLQGGVDIRLPEVGAGAAWARLAEYDRLHKILGREVKMLDLRLPDRLTIRPVRAPEEPKPAAGRET